MLTILRSLVKGGWGGGGMGVNTNERWRDVGFFFSLVYFCFVMGFFSFGAGYAIVLFWGFLGWVFFFVILGGGDFLTLTYLSLTPVFSTLIVPSLLLV